MPTSRKTRSRAPAVLVMPARSKSKARRRFNQLSARFASVVEAVAKLGVNLPGIVPVKSAESQAIVQLHAPVGHIESGQRDGVVFGEGLSESQIECGVGRADNFRDTATPGSPLVKPEP